MRHGNLRRAAGSGCSALSRLGDAASTRGAGKDRERNGERKNKRRSRRNYLVPFVLNAFSCHLTLPSISSEALAIPIITDLADKNLPLFGRTSDC